MILPPLVFPVKSVYQAQSVKNTISLGKFYFSQIAYRRQYLLFSRLCKHFLWLINICEVFKNALNFAVHTAITLHWGARKLMGENLKLVWAEFSTISLAVLMMCMYSSKWMHDHTSHKSEPSYSRRAANGDPGKKGKKIITGHN